MMKSPLQQTWDLDSFFPNGSSSQEFSLYLNKLAENIKTFSLTNLNPKEKRNLKEWEETIKAMQDLAVSISYASAFTGCLASQDIFDRQAQIHAGNIRSLNASFQAVMISIEQQLIKLGEEE